MFFGLLACSSQDQDIRPDDVLLLDNAQLLADVAESLENQLHHIADNYGVEVVLATVPGTGSETIKEMSARLFTIWSVGREYSGNGLLLLLAEGEKEVRLEVGLALEGVFTDLFTGYIEDKQLKSYFLSNQLEIGLIAVLEEIEARAALMLRNSASVDQINALDMRFLSAGGGADVELSNYRSTHVARANKRYPAGRSPDEAWQTLLQSWRDKNRDPDLGVYTPVTRLIYRDFTNQPDRRFDEDVRTWGNKAYEVIQDGDYAVIFFGKKKGWDNAPFLFCRTAEGWQFDMVHQRKIVRMGRSPLWGIERGEHPYIHLLSRCPYWMGQDIPRRGEDLYDVLQDGQTAQSVLALEQQLTEKPNDFDILLKLGRLYTLTSMNQKRFKLLKEADTIQPNHPEVIKTLAIAHVDAHYQYQNALDLMDTYVSLQPEDPFGYFYRAYLLIMLEQPSDAITSLQEGLALEPDNIYGLCKLVRAHLAAGRETNRETARLVFQTAESGSPDHIRIKWLRRLLRDYGKK